MAKEQASLLKEQLFFSDAFQKKWKNYLIAFGKDLNMLFDNDYDKKIHLAAGLEHLLNNRLNDAYNEIRHFESYCKTDKERLIFNKLIALCLNEKEMATVKVGDWVKQSHGGYYRVIKRTPEYAVIKSAFDHKFVYVKQSEDIDGFVIKLTD